MYVQIKQQEMVEFLTSQGFVEIKIDGTKEMVFSKLVDLTVGKEVCLRVYTSVVPGESDSGVSRKVGQDAIRVCLVSKVNGEVRGIGSDRRVNRVEGWKKNLQSRLNSWEKMMGPSCVCGCKMVHRNGKFGEFWGCSSYPMCRQTIKIVKEEKVA